jgi:predicted ATP-grasp superfamily ATP-dependent carboligase
MRILVHEFVSGGGYAGRDVPIAVARQGVAMRAALVADLAAIGGHQVVTTADPRFPCAAPSDVEVVTLANEYRANMDSLVDSVDAVWLVAPETDRCMERLAARTERKGKRLLGSDAVAIRRASDKRRLARRLRRHGVAHPDTRVVRDGIDYQRVAREMGYPLVVKPVHGAGCQGVCLARDARELPSAIAFTQKASRSHTLLCQRYVRGVNASVSLLADGARAVALAVNRQSISGAQRLSVGAAQPFAYNGGKTPLDHPLAARAVDQALRTCEALPGLRGFVGIDMVLTASEAVVIEVNPRLTTAYLGVRAALGCNVAAMTLAACDGCLPRSVHARRRVRFTASGRIMAA